MAVILSSQWFVSKGTNITKDLFTVLHGAPADSCWLLVPMTNMLKYYLSMLIVVMQQVSESAILFGGFDFQQAILVFDMLCLYKKSCDIRKAWL